MYDGELIKKLRMNRKLTQSQLAKGICSKTSLVGMENQSVQKISFLTLKSFLDRMNMTLAEYEWIRNQVDEPTKEKKKRDLLNKVHEDSFDPYKEIADNRRQFKKTADVYYLVLNLHLFWKNGTQHELQLEFLRYECRTIEEYFTRMQEYGHFELAILAEFPSIFSDSFIENNYMKIKKRMRQLADFKSDEQRFFTFLKNLTLYYIENKRYKKARSVNEDLQRSLAFKKKSEVIYERLMSEYHRRLISAALGEPILAEEIQPLFSVIEYTLGENQRKELEEKLLECAKSSS
ncbi:MULTISPECIES: helix-turn-helix transcriptional regulator [unclassified Enterococcus]|uniref:helix-turn-helix domain-containing protein n=1 Tax=unclassified Enterococcus TaxID=2608891 RepID=UPI0013EB2C99|nr:MULTISPECIES: helix-turn-helix transcriptional regulator [unclassified Enterococcus]